MARRGVLANKEMASDFSSSSRGVRGAAMLVGMTVPPGGRDGDKANERRLRGVAGTGTLSDEVGDNAGEATEQVQDADARSREMHENGDAVRGTDTAHGNTPEQVRRAAQLEDRSFRHVQRQEREATEARDLAAEAHNRAARLHDRQADLGWGNVEEHRQQAHEHRENAAADDARIDP
jgi:hypothetical protein